MSGGCTWNQSRSDEQRGPLKAFGLYKCQLQKGLHEWMQNAVEADVGCYWRAIDFSQLGGMVSPSYMSRDVTPIG